MLNYESVKQNKIEAQSVNDLFGLFLYLYVMPHFSCVSPVVSLADKGIIMSGHCQPQAMCALAC